MQYWLELSLFLAESACARPTPFSILRAQLRHTHTHGYSRSLDFLEDSEISEDVTTTIKGNDLGRKEFLCLNEGEIKELAPKIGARVNLITKQKVCYDHT